MSSECNVLSIKRTPLLGSYPDKHAHISSMAHTLVYSRLLLPLEENIESSIYGIAFASRESFVIHYFRQNKLHFI
jgi:hypothetical protein